MPRSTVNKRPPAKTLSATSAKPPPKHTADEEEGLFLRLRSIDSPEIRGVLARMDTREDDHPRAARDHVGAGRPGRKWLGSGGVSQEDENIIAATLTRRRCQDRRPPRVERTLRGAHPKVSIGVQEWKLR